MSNVTNTATIKGKQGLLFESAVVNHILVNAKKFGYTIYYYHDSDGKEIDLIIGNKIDENVDDFSMVMEDRYILCEIKPTSEIDTAVVKSKWINSQSIPIEGKIAVRYSKRIIKLHYQRPQTP